MAFTVQKFVLPILCFALALLLNDAYHLRRGSVSDPDASIARALALTALVIVALYGAVPSLRPSDDQILTLFILLLGASYLYFALRRRVRSIRSDGGTSRGRNVLVFGTSAVARAAAHELERRGYTAIRFVETYVNGNPRQSLHAISRASEVIAETKPVRIIVCLRSPLEELPLCELFEQQIGGVPVETGHEAYERLTGKIFLDERTPLHLLLSHAGLSNRAYAATKRFVSATVAAVGLLAALPVMALIALTICVTEGGPVLFVQDRVGLHGRPFRLLKFRSMRVEDATSSEWERDNENRITPLGRWLRKLHLDELPQLWNILRGDMDLLGPRPHPVSNHKLFARSIPYYSLRSLVRPGLTGWAQVRHGYAQDLPGEIEKMRYDLCAIARPSLLRDLWVLLATAKIILLGHRVEREGVPAAEKAEAADRVAVRLYALPARAQRPRLDPQFAQILRTMSERGSNMNSWERPGIEMAGDLKEPGVSFSSPRWGVETNEHSPLVTRGGSSQPRHEERAMPNQVARKIVAQPPAAAESDAVLEPEVITQSMWDRIETLEASRRRAPRVAAACFSPQTLAKSQKRRRAGYPNELVVRVYPDDAASSVHRPLKGFARLFAVVATLSIASATLRLIPQTWNKVQPDPAPLAAAMAIAPSEPTSPGTAAVTGASDLASLDAAAVRAKAIVRGSEISSAKILKPVLAKRIGGASSVNGITLPRYHAEVAVELQRYGVPIQRKYFVTLQDIGSGEWHIERVEFATRY